MDGKKRKISSLRKTVAKKAQDESPTSLDLMDPEDREIQRLEKLLGIDKKKKKKTLRDNLAAKLDEEYDKFEGIGGGFGSFLLELDELTERVQEKTAKCRKDKDDEEDEVLETGQDEADDEEGRSKEENENEGSNDDMEDDAEEMEGEGGDNEEEDDEDDEEAKEKIALAKQLEAENAKFTYRPTQGEDIYGRIIDPTKASSSGTSKYVPPAKRNVISMNPTSEKEVLLKRKITNIVNKLSEGNKDALLRELKGLYDTHSHILCTTYLYHTILEMVIHSSQRMTTQIALYCSIFAGLYHTVGQEVIYEGMEIVFKKLHTDYLCKVFTYYDTKQADADDEDNKKKDDDIRLQYHRPIYNLMLFFIYFYNYRILNHAFLVEMITLLLNPLDFSLFRPATAADVDSTNTAKSTTTTSGYGKLVEEGILEIRLEMLEGILTHGMEYLRHDEPNLLPKLSQDIFKLMQYQEQHLQNGTNTNINGAGKTMIKENPVTNAIIKITTYTNQPIGSKSNTVTNSGNNNNVSVEEAVYTRLNYLSEVIQTMIRNPTPSHGTGNGNSIRMVVVNTRKWLGTVKRLLGNVTNDLLIRMKVTDLLYIELQGRWWKTGASWIGRQQSQSNNNTSINGNNNSYHSNGQDEYAAVAEGKVSKVMSAEEEAMQEQSTKLAKKLHCHTPIRKSILTQILLSNDIQTTYENLMKLSLKGKHDREIIKVLMECALHEKQYNKYYTELIELFLAFDRQFKLTCQYTVWDLMKFLHEEFITLASEYTGEDYQEGDTYETLESDDSFFSIKDVQSLHRKALNLGRLVAELVRKFHLPLSSIMKPVDMTNFHLMDKFFLSSFFFALLHYTNEELSQDAFQSICDRIATSNDYALIRDNALLFLQSHMKELPTKGLKTEHIQHMKQRKKFLVKTLKEMDVLDYQPGSIRKGNDREEEDDFMGQGKRKKSKKMANRNNPFFPQNLPADFDE